MFGKLLRPLTASVTLASPAPPADVWAALTDAPRWPQVLPDLASARIDPDGVLAAGASIKTVALPDRNVIDMTYRVIEAEPPHRLVLASSAEGFSAQTVYQFNAGSDGGTEITVTAFVKPERIGNKIGATISPEKYNAHIEQSIRRRTSALLELVGDDTAR